MLTQHVGRDQMIFPPFEPERMEELGELVPTDFDIMGAGWREVSEPPRLRIYKQRIGTAAATPAFLFFICVCVFFFQ